MPRQRNAQNEPRRSAQERYRERLLARGGVETDAADAAIAAAVAVFRAEAERLASQRNIVRVNGLEQMAASFLISKGKDPQQALRAVRLRTRRLDVAELLPLVSGRAGSVDSGSSSDVSGTLSRPSV